MVLPRLFCSLIRRSSGGNGSFRQAIQKKNGSSRKVGGANNGLGEAPKSCTRKEHESATNSIAKRGQRGDFVPFRLPLAGSRDSVPCGVWGNAPTVPRPTSIANALNKGADSEASLPLTLRVRRRAPKLLFPQDSVMNQKTQTAKRRVPPPARRFAVCANYFCLSPDLSFCSAASAAACSACFFVRPVPWASSTPKRLTAASNVRLCGGPSCAIIS